MYKERSTHVAVLYGGVSAEREVSLSSGAHVARALDEAGFFVSLYDTKDLGFISKLRADKPDVVFIALHGRFGEDGTIQGLLELMGLPYVGSGVLASALAIDKVMSKHFYKMAGIPTPCYRVANRAKLEGEGDALAQFLDEVVKDLGEKLVIKPAREGSSIGMSIVRESSKLEEAVLLAFEYDEQVLIEQFVEGREVTVGVLGNHSPKALPTIEIIHETEFFDYEAKYTEGLSSHIIPARQRNELNELCQALAVQAHEALGCKGVSRSDFLVDRDEQVWLLETITLPGMTDLSLVPDAAAHAEIDFPMLCEMLVAFALEK